MRHLSSHDLVVEGNHPTQLLAAPSIQLWPTDSGGFYDQHKDAGRLIKLTKDEVAIAVQAQTGEEIRIHAPRWQFRVRAINAAGKL